MYAHVLPCVSAIVVVSSSATSAHAVLAPEPSGCFSSTTSSSALCASPYGFHAAAAAAAARAASACCCLASRRAFLVARSASLAASLALRSSFFCACILILPFVRGSAGRRGRIRGAGVTWRRVEGGSTTQPRVLTTRNRARDGRVGIRVGPRVKAGSRLGTRGQRAGHGDFDKNRRVGPPPERGSERRADPRCRSPQRAHEIASDKREALSYIRTKGTYACASRERRGARAP